MPEIELVYEVQGVRQAAEVVRDLDTIHPDVLVGMAVIARGYAESREEFYVFANLESPSAADIDKATGILETYGKRTQHSLTSLTTGTPRPHLITSGRGSQILTVLKGAYPETGLEPRPAN